MARKLQLLFRGSQVVDDNEGSVVDKVNQITQDLIDQEYSPVARAAVGSGEDSEDEIRPLETLNRVIGGLKVKGGRPCKASKRSARVERRRRTRRLRQSKDWRELAFPPGTFAPRVPSLSE